MNRVVVVDDNADVRLLMAHVLRSAGFEVKVVDGGHTALAFLRSAEPRPDVVLLDVQMPALDGWDTLERIRAATDVPVILCTVKGRPSDRERGWRLGCDGYLTKPFDARVLVGEVRSVIARSQPERLRARQAGLVEAGRHARAAG
jgi:DNA-binding response OmpR family regulator